MVGDKDIDILRCIVVPAFAPVCHVADTTGSEHPLEIIRSGELLNETILGIVSRPETDRIAFAADGFLRRHQLSMLAGSLAVQTYLAEKNRL